MFRPLRWATRALPLTRKLLQKLDQKSLNTDEAIYIERTTLNHNLFCNPPTFREEQIFSRKSKTHTAPQVQTRLFPAISKPKTVAAGVKQNRFLDYQEVKK